MCSQAYLKPQSDSDPCYMICPKCQCPALREYWHWDGIPEDQLGCPNCGKEVPIGNWIEGIPPKPEKQKCLMCGGTGECG